MAALDRRAIPIAAPMRSPHGIGGAATPIATFLCPTFLGGDEDCIFLEKTMLEEDVPDILGVGLLACWKSKIDLENDLAVFSCMAPKAYPMHALPSKH